MGGLRTSLPISMGHLRVEKKAAAHVHESPLVMTIPLILLALLSVSTGWVGIPGSVNRIGPFLDPLLSAGATHAAVEGSAMLHWVVPGLPVAAALLGWWCAYLLYVKRPELPDYWAGRLAPLYRGSFHKWYVDECYDGLLVRPTVRVTGFLWRWCDVRIINGLVNEVAALLNRWATQTQQFQSGQLQHDALVMTMGLFVLVTLYLLW